MQDHKKSLSWFWIVVAFIIFWPIGVALLLYKIHGDRSAIMGGGKTLAKLSLALFGVGGLFILLGIMGESGVLFYGVLMVVGGFYLNRKAKSMNVKSDRYRLYLSLIVNQGLTSLDSIAAGVGVPYDQCIGELQNMINEGYFKGSYIDQTNRQFVLIHAAPAVPVAVSPTAEPITPKVVSCPGCGANNTVFGALGECEYCGSPLQS